VWATTSCVCAKPEKQKPTPKAKSKFFFICLLILVYVNVLLILKNTKLTILSHKTNMIANVRIKCFVKVDLNTIKFAQNNNIGDET
jgi:hypothetical protein